MDNELINNKENFVERINALGPCHKDVLDMESLIEEQIGHLEEAIKDYMKQAVKNVIEDNDDVYDLYRVLLPIMKSCGIDREDFDALWSMLDAKYFSKLEEKLLLSEEIVPFESPVQMSASKLVTGSQSNNSGRVQLDWLASKRTVASQVDRARLEKIEARHQQRREKLKGIKKDGKEAEAPTDKQERIKISEAQVERAQLEDILEHGLQGSVRQDIQISDFDISIGSKRILTNATVSLSFGHIYGLVGRNGIGKSTLLRHISGRDLPLPGNLSILHVEQEAVGDETPVIEAVLKSDRRRYLLKKEEEYLMNSTGSMDTRLKRVNEILLELDADSAQAKAGTILAGLGFSTADQSRPTREFSGGWRMRVALACALFCQPDLLLLDEPTNMLDIPAVAWLEDHLNNSWSGTVVVVSHDRAFLNGVATDILHLHDEIIDAYKGDYEQFVVTKEERLKNAQREYDNQLAYREHLQSFIDRWRCNANRASQAQSRLKVLEKLPDLPSPVVVEPQVVFKFPPVEPLPSPIISLESVSFGYPGGGKVLLKDLDLSIEAKSKMALVGPNGVGKTTLLKIMTGQLDPVKGIARINPRLRVAYFSQHHVDQLDMRLSSVELFVQKFPGKTEEEVRRMLGAFGISGPLALQKINTLSGGQKSRVVFSMLAGQSPHVLVLDEPTNHLDMDSIDALTKACLEFDGSIIAVSHDQRFISSLCNDSIYVCNNQTVARFPGGILDYIKGLRVVA